MWVMSKLACQEEGQGQRGEGMRRLVGGNHQRKALEDRNLLFGKHLSLAMRQVPSHLEKQHCILALGRGPRHQAQSTLRRLPRSWPRSPSEPFLGVPGMSPCNILTLPPTTTSSCLPSLGVRATCRGPAEFLQNPQPRGKGQHPSSTMSTTHWGPKCTDTSQDPSLLSTCL